MAGKKFKWFLIISLIGTIVVGLWAAAFAISGGSLGIGGGSAAYEGDFEEQILVEGSSDNKVAMINVVGEIFSDPEESSAGATDTSIIAQLEQAVDDDLVKAVILNLETPGGGVVASDTIYRKVESLKRGKKDLPVVALMGDVAASGGYYIAAGADEIVAHPSTWTGSIGVIAMLPNVQKAADKFGVGVTVLKSGAFKDAGSPFREMAPEEKALFQGLIDESYGQFVDVIAKGREMRPEKVRQLADGRIYSGTQAKSNGLVDRLGGRDLAFRRAKQISKSRGASLVLYRMPDDITDLLDFGIEALSPSKALEKNLGVRRRPGLSYLWLP